MCLMYSDFVFLGAVIPDSSCLKQNRLCWASFSDVVKVFTPSEGVD